MRKAAETGRGTFTIISALQEVGEKMDRLFRKLESPQVTDIEVQWPSGVLVDSYPGVVPDLYLGEPIVVRARASGAFRSGDAVRITGNSVAGAWSTELALGGRPQSAGVAALWGRARIEDLLDRMRRGAGEDEMRPAVVETALAHHLVSKYTSLVAVDKTPVRPAGEGLDSEQVASLRPHGQSAAAMSGFAATATNAEMLRLTGLTLLLLALAIMAWPLANRRRSDELLH
jgi:Ca-activated chloride channel family protein